MSEVGEVRELLVRSPASIVASANPSLALHQAGWLEKEGGSGIKGFQKRWFVLLGPVCEPGSPTAARSCRYFVYYESPQAAAAKGCIVLLDSDYSATYPKNKRRKHPFCFRIDIRPTRHPVGYAGQKLKWVLAAADEEQRRSWMAVLGEAAAALTNRLQVRKLYRKRGAARVEASAERGGWLWKAGKLNPSFKKRWCLLLPPPSDTGGGDDGDYGSPAAGRCWGEDDGPLDRYLSYFRQRDSHKPRGVLALPHRGYTVQAFDLRAPGAAPSSLPAAMRNTPQALKLKILHGPESGTCMVLAAESDNDHFAWELSLRAGEYRQQAFVTEGYVAAAAAAGHVHTPFPEQSAALQRIAAQAAAAFDREDPADLGLLQRFWQAAHVGEVRAHRLCNPSIQAPPGAICILWRGL